MRILLAVLAACLALLALSACGAGGQTGTTPSAGGPTAASTPRAGQTRPANFTPAANFTPGGQRPSTQRTPQAGATSVPGGATARPTPTATSTIGAAPTAVTIPQVTIPTSVPPSSVTPAAPVPAATPVSAAPRAPVVQTPQPSVSLDSLRGKIVFFSDRGGLYAQLYVMNPDGSDQRLCNCSDLLEGMVSDEASSPDHQQFLFVKQMGGDRGRDYQIWVHDNQTNTDKAMTGGPPGFPTVDYDPAWSPNGRSIAWVTEANGYDEIYVYDRISNENNRLTESHGEWYKHPSYSPDGAQITYWTNLNNVNLKQIWVMNADGSGQHNIGNSQFNDWSPIWVK